MYAMELVDLQGRKGLIVGIANEHSLAWSATQRFRGADAELGATYLNDKAKPYVEPLAREIEAAFLLPCNVTSSGQLEAVFDAIKDKWAGSTSCSIRSHGRARRIYTGG